MLNIAVCSHRGPVSFSRIDSGLQLEKVGPGGLVAAVAPGASRLGATWIYAASSECDREVARTLPHGVEHDGMLLRPLDLPEADHRRHYREISSAVLAPLFHYMFALTYRPAFTRGILDAWRSYTRVNELFAESILRLRSPDAVLVEDSHLMLVARALRAKRSAPDFPLTYFHHVPWCDPTYFGVLPEPMRVEILEGMLMFDSVGFHSTRWAQSFVACCERFLRGARRQGECVEWRQRQTNIAVSPAAIDVAGVLECRDSEHAQEWRERFLALRGDGQLIVRVERADPSKNAVRGLLAYERLLERDPSRAATTQMLAVLTPVREWVGEYRNYYANIQLLARRINQRYGGRQNVVHLEIAEDAHRCDHARAVAALAVADVHVVNPTFDGLNLVAIEGAVAGDSALVLSENAGIHESFEAFVQSVNPFDIDETTDALDLTLGSPVSERRLASHHRATLAENSSPVEWMTGRIRRCGVEPPAFVTPAVSLAAR
jgi:trehalose 6-phosphate synthase